MVVIRGGSYPGYPSLLPSGLATPLVGALMGLRTLAPLPLPTTASSVPTMSHRLVGTFVLDRSALCVTLSSCLLWLGRVLVARGS